MRLLLALISLVIPSLTQAAGTIEFNVKPGSSWVVEINPEQLALGTVPLPPSLESSLDMFSPRNRGIASAFIGIFPSCPACSQEAGRPQLAMHLADRSAVVIMPKVVLLRPKEGEELFPLILGAYGKQGSPGRALGQRWLEHPAGPARKRIFIQRILETLAVLGLFTNRWALETRLVAASVLAARKMDDPRRRQEGDGILRSLLSLEAAETLPVIVRAADQLSFQLALDHGVAAGGLHLLSTAFGNDPERMRWTLSAMAISLAQTPISPDDAPHRENP